MLTDKINFALNSALLQGNITTMALQKVADKAGDPEMEETLHLLAIYTADTNTLLQLIVMRLEESEDPIGGSFTLPTPPATPKSWWKRLLAWLP